MRLLYRAITYALAVAGSAALAAIVYAVQLGVITKFDEVFGATSDGLWLMTTMMGFILALPAFAIGSAAVGAVVWFLLGRVEEISKWSAALFGALLTTLGGGSLFALTLGFEGLFLAMPLPISGAIGGIALRKIMRDGFIRPKPPPAPPV